MALGVKFANVLYIRYKFNFDKKINWRKKNLGSTSRALLSKSCSIWHNPFKSSAFNYNITDIAHIIPVPNYESNTHCNAPLIANLLAEKIRKRTGKNIHSYPDVLKRSNKTWRRRGRTERRLSAETDYQISDYIKNNNNLIKDNRLLLVDDIITSGFTTEVCQDLLYDKFLHQEELN